MSTHNIHVCIHGEIRKISLLLTEKKKCLIWTYVPSSYVCVCVCTCVCARVFSTKKYMQGHFFSNLFKIKDVLASHRTA